MTEDGYIPVDSATLQTRYPGVYAVGDVAERTGTFHAPSAALVADKQQFGASRRALWFGA